MNSTYAILPIGIFALLIYLLSFTGTRLSIISQKSHRRFWNIILLVTFLVTAIIGFTLALQVNYKLNIPFSKDLLKWHVNFGIGMTLVAVFHFTWHWDYYLNILKKDRKKSLISHEIELPEEKSDSEFGYQHFLSLFCLGFTAIVTQIVVLREFMSVFYGNELVTGVILANWMILTAIGAKAGRYSLKLINKKAFQGQALIILSFYSIIVVILINTLKNAVFQPGSMVGIFQVLITSAVLLLPFCLLSGFMFTYLSGWLSGLAGRNMINKAYAAESAGSVAGGILLSFILIFFLKSLQILSILLSVNILHTFLNTLLRKEFKSRWYFLFAGIACVLVIFAGRLDINIKKFLFPNQELIYHKDTPYGSLSITKSAEQLNFYENTSLIFTTGDPVTVEEDVHYAMVQHPDPKNILLLSGSISGSINEILKYPVSFLDCIEINPWIIKIGRKYTTDLDNPKVNIIAKDPRIFLRTTNTMYDVILMPFPEPNTAQVNRYYTKEFYKLVKDKLLPGGVVSLALPSTVNYVSEEANNLNSIIFNTLRPFFRNLVFIPGNKNYLLASDGPLSVDIPGLVELRGIENIYVNQYYLDDNSLHERSQYIMDQLDESLPVNQDFKPVCYVEHLRYWMSHFSVNYWFPLGIILLLFLILLLRMKSLSVGMFAAGFAGSSFELLLIITFQILYGYVYQYIGIIITIFMAGLAIGALIRDKFLSSNIFSFLWIQLLIVLFAVIFPLLILLLDNFTPYIALLHVLFTILTLTISILVGMQFSLGTVLLRGVYAERAAEIYSADLIGSALGAILISAFLIPMLGIITSSLIIGGLNLASAAVIYISRKSYL